MIVIGIDPHMKSHVAVTVDAASGRRLAETCVGSDAAGCEALLSWAHGLGEERLIAVEDCHHVSGRLERHLLPRGERLVRVPPKLMARSRASARTPGKSDPIDAECVARAALREPGLPEARLPGPEHDVRLLADHRDDLVGERRHACDGTCTTWGSTSRCRLGRSIATSGSTGSRCAWGRWRRACACASPSSSSRAAAS